jgi:5-methylcytosine-specific restriction protein B
MAIPNFITRQHIINAIQRIGSPDNIPNIRRARRQALRYNNRNYPLKYVICIAHEIATGQEYSYKEFTTNIARDYINGLGGFDIIDI